MVSKSDLEKMYEGQTINSLAYIKSYEVRESKNGTKYIDGVLEMKGTVMFKVWSGALFDEMVKYNYTNTICNISGKVNLFGGSISLILDRALAVEDSNVSVDDFFASKYDTENYWVAFCNLMKKVCSDDGYKIFSQVFSGIEDRFKVEFAARGHHDAFKSGLLAHTYKVCVVMYKTVTLYKPIISSIDMDLIMLGCAFHDIGKVEEYSMGVVSDRGILISHHTFGVEMLSKHKDYIVGIKGLDFYYRLLAIIEQHHGEYEETPRTIEAYLVHLADNMESRLEIISEHFEGSADMLSVGTFRLR